MHILPHHMLQRKVSGGALTVPVGSFASQLDFLDFDSCPCPGPFLPVMSSFVIFNLETAKNSEQFSLKVNLNCHDCTLTHLNTFSVSSRKVPVFPSEQYRAEAERG